MVARDISHAGAGGSKVALMPIVRVVLWEERFQLNGTVFTGKTDLYGCPAQIAFKKGYLRACWCWCATEILIRSYGATFSIIILHVICMVPCHRPSCLFSLWLLPKKEWRKLRLLIRARNIRTLSADAAKPVTITTNEQKSRWKRTVY